MDNIEKKFIENYFGLSFDTIDERQVLKGKLNFSVIYDFQKKQYKILNPSKEYAHPDFIKDSYFIEIDLKHENFYRNVREVGKKIERNANKLSKKVSDLHMQEGGVLCVAGYFDEIDNIALKDFIIDILIPFLYDQSYYLKSNGKIWPRGEYSHGYLGILENYYEKVNCLDLVKDGQKIKNLSKKCIYFIAEVTKKDLRFLQYLMGSINKGFIRKMRCEMKCICQFGNQNNKLYQECHPDAYRGFVFLAESVIRFKLKKHVLKAGLYK